MTEITKKHGDHIITITDTMVFKVVGPLINRNFGSFLEAQQAIDDAEKKHQAQMRKRIALKVLDEQGVSRTITGIHAGNGSILGCDGDFYQDVPWVAKALQEIARLRKEVKSLQGSIVRYRMSRYSMNLTLLDDHSTSIDRLVRAIETMTEAARNAELQ